VVERSRPEGAKILVQTDIFADSGYFHSGFGVGAAGDEGFFFVADLDPDLTFEAVAIPAELAVADRFHIEKLKATEDRIVLRHLHVPTADGYVDQLFIWLENLGFAHCRKFTAATLNTANANFLITTHPFVKLFRYKGMTYVDRYIHKAGMSVLPTGA